MKNENAAMKVISCKATILDREGYITQQGVTVIDAGDIIGIGACTYPRHELEISAERIVSKIAGWEVAL